VEGGEGRQLENTTAVCLLKHVQFLQDVKGSEVSLHYLRTKDEKEIDFGIAKKDSLISCIEVKLSDEGVSPSLRYFKEKIPGVLALQLVHNARHDHVVGGVSLMRAGHWLSQLDA